MTEVTIYTLEELTDLFCSFIPIGILLSAFPLIIGYTIYGILKIFNRA